MVMKIVKFEELKERFPDIRDIKPYGFCVVVPGSEFDPDWEFQLEDQGYKVYMVDLDRKPVALVSCVKKNAVAQNAEKAVAPASESLKTPKVARGRGLKPGDKIVPWTESDLARLMEEWSRIRGDIEQKAEALTKFFPGRTANAIKQRYLKQRACDLKQLKAHREDPPSEKHPPSEKRGAGLLWSEVEMQKLVSFWNQGMLKSEIAKAFPGRSEKSVIMAITRLKLKGVIQKRYSRGQQAGRVPKVEEVHEKAPLKAPESDKKLPTENLVCFDTYCRKCRQRRNVEDSAVWTVCPICQEPLIIWNVEEKVVEI